MIKVKTISAEMSAWNLINAYNRGDISRRYEAKVENIDKKLNDFIKDKEVIDIKINDVTIHQNSNGYCDGVMRTYTIFYKE